MDIKRIIRHVCMSRREVQRAFPPAALQEIEHAIQASEQSHTGELRFVIEGALDGAPLYRGQSARERAIDVFSQQRVWDTEENSGLLIYLLLADRAVEIVADRGIHAKVDHQEWNMICQQMESAFRQTDFAAGALRAIQAVTQHLSKHFPAHTPSQRNELSDQPLIL